MTAAKIITATIIFAISSASFANTKCTHQSSSVGIFASTAATSSNVAAQTTQTATQAGAQ